MTLQFNSGCDNDSGEVTPKGCHISQHVINNIRARREKHNVSWAYIDLAIDNAQESKLQPDNSMVYVYRQLSRTRAYTIVVLENVDCVVTAIKDLEPREVKNIARNNGWSGLRF